MRLWVDTSAVNTAGRAIQARVSETMLNIDRQIVSRATRALNELRNAELEVLRGQRSGHVYRKYPYKSTYTASAPGEPPARRTGNLRLHWNGTIDTASSKGGVTVSIVLESQERYSGYLEGGTRKMKARPFHDRIVEKAKPGIAKIYGESYR